ncbi:MAG: hydrogenase formation protein HypD, partial [Planctomycetota bacterium]
MSEDPRRLAAQLATVCDAAGPMAFMEVCGTHTVALFRSGLKSMLPPDLRLVSGPGCPVCVTAQGYIDAAIALAREPGTTVATYGDMVRVPGTTGSLAEARASGGDILVCFGARDAVAHARAHPERQVVFLAVGFETTAPGSAVAVLEAAAAGLDNFSILPGHKLVVPAMTALLDAGAIPLQGFLCPGHVSVIIGSEAYAPLV